MRVITVARKPVEGTVARNALKYGTGGLNIDAARIFATDDQLAEKYRSVGTAPPRTNQVFGVDQRPRKVEPAPGGRWPANVILQHRPGCQRAGAKKVKATSIHGEDVAVRRSGVHEEAGGHQTIGRAQPVHGYADEDGMETVDAWECVEDCPVVHLDRQSGVTSSGAMKREVPAYEGTSITGMIRGRSGPSNQHGDEGGASRFFKQVRKSSP